MYTEIGNPVDYKVALYIRLSKEDDHESESQSVTNQRSILREYTKEHKLYVYDEYIDDGFSGGNFDRPAFSRLIDDIEAKKVNMVLTKDAYVKYRLKFYEDFLWGFTMRIVFVFNTYIARHFFQYEKQANCCRNSSYYRQRNIFIQNHSTPKNHRCNKGMTQQFIHKV